MQMSSQNQNMLFEQMSPFWSQSDWGNALINITTIPELSKFISAKVRAIIKIKIFLIITICNLWPQVAALYKRFFGPKLIAPPTEIAKFETNVYVNTKTRLYKTNVNIKPDQMTNELITINAVTAHLENNKLCNSIEYSEHLKKIISKSFTNSENKIEYEFTQIDPRWTVEQIKCRFYKEKGENKLFLNKTTANIEKKEDSSSKFEQVVDEFFVLEIVYNDQFDKTIGYDAFIKELITTHTQNQLVHRKKIYWFDTTKKTSTISKLLINDYTNEDTILSFDRYDTIFHPMVSVVKNSVNRLKNKEEFVKNGTPRKFAALLHGPPGTGKTSLVRAISNDTGRHIVSLSLNDPKFIENLSKNMYSDVAVTNASVIYLIDEINLYDKDGKMVNELESLLSALDGIGNYDNMIIIATTNKEIKDFPEALVRPGRLTPIFIDYIDDASLQKMVRHYFGNDIEWPFIGEPVELSGAMARNIVQNYSFIPDSEKYIKLKKEVCDLELAKTTIELKIKHTKVPIDITPYEINIIEAKKRMEEAKARIECDRKQYNNITITQCFKALEKYYTKE